MALAGDGPPGPLDFQGLIAQGPKGEFHFGPAALGQGFPLVVVRPIGPQARVVRQQLGVALLHFAAQFDRQPLGRAFAHARRLAEAPQVRCRDGAHQFVDFHGPEQGQGHLGTHPADGHQIPEKIPLLTVAEAEQGPAILTDTVMGVQGQIAPGGGQPCPLPQGQLHLVADAPTDQQESTAVARPPGFGDLTPQPADHGDPRNSPMLPFRTLVTHLRRTLVMLALASGLVLAGCHALGQPPRSVLLSALAEQIQTTQLDVAQALQLEPMGRPQVSRVRVESQEAMSIGTARGWHLTGRFDWRLSGDPIRVDSPFDLYLQAGERQETWRLARPLIRPDGSADWLTYPLPLPDAPRA